MPTPPAITTILEVGNTVAFADWERGDLSHGTIFATKNIKGRGWLFVVRGDGSKVVVAPNEVKAKLEVADIPEVVVPAPLPEVVQVIEREEAPPVVILAVPVPKPVFARENDRVRFLSPWGMEKIGVVFALDTTKALVEVGDDLEEIDVGDIKAVLAASPLI